MANLQETSTWEAGIYQLETSDPVMGGENGIDNRAPRQLANRTLWLKNELARQIGVVNSGKLGKTENAVSATKLATARNIAMTGDGSWNVNFDGSGNATGVMTLSNSGVTTGSYNSVTVDAKGRVTAGLTQTHGLVTATTATGTANVATGNGNTFLNIVASGVGQTASVGSSTQITGTNGITVSSDTAGRLIVTRDNNSPTAAKLQTARTINGVAFDGTQNITIVDNTKLANTGNPTLNGRLSITNNEWAKLNFPLQDGSQWFIEANPNYKTAQTGGLGIRFLCEDGNARRFYDLVKSDKNETIAYQSWVNGELAKKANVSHRHNWNDIDSKPAVITNPTQITSGDLDNYKEIGVYYCEGNAYARDIANTPSNRAFALEVVRAAGVVQIFREYETAIVYMRAFYSRWSPWKRLATTEDNAPTATKLATARTLAITGDGTGQANFDGSNNANIALTLANSGVTAGSYNSVTVDAKGRVTAGLTQTHGLVTATTATGTANTATTNSNTFLNIVASGVGTANSVGSSTQITGTNGISVSSDTAGKLIVTRDSNSPTATRLQTARNIALTGAVTGNVNFDGSGNVSIGTALNLTEFANLKAENGYQRLPNGLIFQWGKLASDRYLGESAQSITFPISFPTACLNVQANMYMTRHSAQGDGGVFVVDFDRSTANFSLQNIGSSSIGDLRGFYWFAIGY